MRSSGTGEANEDDADLHTYAEILAKDLRDAIEVAQEHGVRLAGAELAASMAHRFFDPRGD